MFNADLVKRYPVLDAASELSLTKQYAATKDPKIKDKLVLHNLRFVMHMANKMYKTASKTVKDDLVQEGVIGLMRAIEKYEPSRGIRLCSYGKNWIHVYMQNFLYNGNSLVYRPRNRPDKSEEARLRELSENEIPMERGIFSDWRQVRDSEADHNTPETELLSSDREDYIQNWLTKTTGFNKKQVAVIERRLLSATPETLDEIGKTFGISRERVRQIEKRLMKTLRSTVDESYRTC